MSDADINVRIYKTSYDKLKGIKNWVSVKERKALNQKQTIEYIINEFIKEKNLYYLNKEEFIKYNYLENVRNYNIKLRNYRCDINLNFELMENVKIVQDYLEQTFGRKTSINHVLNTALNEYIQNHPEVNLDAERFRYIKQTIMDREMWDKKFKNNKKNESIIKN